jgi:hypothetical protein
MFLQYIIIEFTPSIILLYPHLPPDNWSFKHQSWFEVRWGQVSILALPIAQWVCWEKSFYLPKAQIPHLKSGSSHSHLRVLVRVKWYNREYFQVLTFYHLYSGDHLNFSRLSEDGGYEITFHKIVPQQMTTFLIHYHSLPKHQSFITQPFIINTPYYTTSTIHTFSPTKRVSLFKCRRIL